MLVCQRCTTHLMPGMSVCTGCGLPMEAGFAPMGAPIAPAPGPSPLVATGPNPYRQAADHEPRYADEPSTYAPEQPVIPQKSETEAPIVPFEAAVGVPQDPPGTALKLTFADPLPPLPPPADPGAATGISVSGEPAPQFAIAEPNVAEPEFVLHDEPQAVPAAYAPFAEETGSLQDFAVTEPAEIVPLVPPGGLTVAPLAPYVADPEAEAARAQSANR